MTEYCLRGPGPNSPFNAPFNGEMTWNVQPNGDRTCSYCGSLHPDDFLDIMQRYAAGEEGYSFSLTDKSYKVYASRANVSNASEGGIKFYGAHAVAEGRPDRAAHEAAWNAAVAKHQEEMRARWGAS